LLTKTARLPGTDNRTMHNSYGNTIKLGDSEEVTTKLVMSMYTDPKRLHADDPGTVEGNPVFEYHDVFNPNKDEVEDFKQKYRQGKIGDVEVKKRLAEALNEYLRPLRERRAELVKQPDEALRILNEGTESARPLVEATTKEVLQKMGLL